MAALASALRSLIVARSSKLAPFFLPGFCEFAYTDPRQSRSQVRRVAFVNTVVMKTTGTKCSVDVIQDQFLAFPAQSSLLPTVISRRNVYCGLKY